MNNIRSKRRGRTADKLSRRPEITKEKDVDYPKQQAHGRASKSLSLTPSQDGPL
jgi:hypothetical protein